MTTLEIVFLVFAPDHTDLRNDAVYEIRKSIAEQFQNHEFGNIAMVGDRQFINTFAIPDTDVVVDEKRLVEIFHFNLPLTHGNYLGLIRDITNFYNHITTHFQYECEFNFNFS